MDPGFLALTGIALGAAFMAGGFAAPAAAEVELPDVGQVAVRLVSEREWSATLASEREWSARLTQ